MGSPIYEVRRTTPPPRSLRHGVNAARGREEVKKMMGSKGLGKLASPLPRTVTILVLFAPRSPLPLEFFNQKIKSYDLLKKISDKNTNLGLT